MTLLETRPGIDSGAGDIAPRKIAHAAITIVAPGPDGAVGFDNDVVVVTAGRIDDVAQSRNLDGVRVSVAVGSSDAHFAINILAPFPDCAVGQSGHGTEVSTRDRNGITQVQHLDGIGTDAANGTVTQFFTGISNRSAPQVQTVPSDFDHCQGINPSAGDRSRSRRFRRGREPAWCGCWWCRPRADRRYCFPRTREFRW